jgi:tryptophan halogenase
MDIPEELGYRSNLFCSSGRVAFHNRVLFVESNWLSVFIGQGIWPQCYDPLADLLPLDAISAHLTHMRNLIRQSAEAMPTHAGFINANRRAGSKLPG